MKPFSVTSKKNYVPSFSKSFVTRPTPPCHNPCAAMRLMPASGQPSTAASTSHFFCIQICTFVFPLKLSSCQEDLSANTLKVTSASFFQNSQKSIFDRNFFFLSMAKLSCAKTPVYHSNQYCFIVPFCFSICLQSKHERQEDSKLSRARFVIFQLFQYSCRTLHVRVLLHYQKHQGL